MILLTRTDVYHDEVEQIAVNENMIERIEDDSRNGSIIHFASGNKQCVKESKEGIIQIMMMSQKGGVTT